MVCRGDRLPSALFLAASPESVEPQFEAEVRAVLAQHSEPDAATGKRMVSGARGDALMDGAASAMRPGANDQPAEEPPLRNYGAHSGSVGHRPYTGYAVVVTMGRPLQLGLHAGDRGK
jgi:hypothetical protein